MPFRGPLCGTPSGRPEMAIRARDFKARTARIPTVSLRLGAALDLHASLRHGGAA